MYNPEDAVEQSFQTLINETLPRFGEFFKEFINDDRMSDLLVGKLQATFEKLKVEYEDYANTFDPKEKLLRRQALETKAGQVLAIVERLTKGIRRYMNHD